MAVKPFSAQSPTDLGLGTTLSDQRDQETEEEKRRKKLAMTPLAANSPAAQSLFGVGAGGMSGLG